MRTRIIAASLVAAGILGACDSNDGPMEEAGESIDEAVDGVEQPNTLKESLDEAAEETADTIEEAADDIDGIVDETGEAMEETTDPPENPQSESRN